MLGYDIPPHHIFIARNIPNSEVEHLHKFEQAPSLSPMLAALAVHDPGSYNSFSRSSGSKCIHVYMVCSIQPYASDLDLSFLEHAVAFSEAQDFVYIPNTVFYKSLLDFHDDQNRCICEYKLLVLFMMMKH